MTSNRKLYAGAKLRELRTRLGLTQKGFAAKLGVSLPYLNQMENNNRPVSTSVVLGLAQEFGFDVTELASGDTERLVSDMREVLADPVFEDAIPPLADLRLTASNAPMLARAFLDLHRAYARAHERLASLDEALGRDDAGATASPWEEVRDFFHYCDNYIDAVDRAAEKLAKAGDAAAAAEAMFAQRGITLRQSAGQGVRHYDPQIRVLTLSPAAEPGDAAVPASPSIRADRGRPAPRCNPRSGAVQLRDGPRDRTHGPGQLLCRCGCDALHPVCRGRRRDAP